MATTPKRRLLLVHAHPDDESITTGGVMAKYAAEGAGVTLVTCTRGEEGEIVPPDLQHLGTGRALAVVREQELADAMRALGVTDHRLLGPYEDSGMIGTPENDKASAFWNVDLDEATRRLVRIVREARPQVVVTYDEHGGYGHPDHIQAHRVTMLAYDAAADPGRFPAEGAPWRIAKAYHVAWGPPDRKRREVAAYEAAGRPGGFDLPPDPEALDAERHGNGAPLTTVVDVSAYVGRKLAAMAAHRTQLTVEGRFFALSNNLVHQVFDEEWFSLAHGEPGPADPVTGLETDLFAGLATDTG